MRMECEICGAYTEDLNEIKEAKETNICPLCRSIGGLNTMEEFTIEIKVRAASSGCAVDWVTRQLMDEVDYCETDTINVYNVDGRDVTNDEETYSGFDKDWYEKQAEIAEYERIADVSPYCI